MLSVTIRRAGNLQCVDRNGPFRPVATAHVDKNNKFKTGVDENGDTNPVWDATRRIPFDRPIDDTTLKIVIFDARNDGNQKRIGSAKLKLREVKNDVESQERTLTLTRRSFRSRGHVVVEVLIDEEPSGTDKPDKQRHWDRVKRIAKAALNGAAVASTLVGIIGTV